MNIEIAIASSNRHELLRENIRYLQRILPANVGVTLGVPHDEVKFLAYDPAFEFVKIIGCDRGLCAQRNSIMDSLEVDIVLFIDDDFILDPDYPARVLELFSRDSSIAMVTGCVVADGIGGKGFTFQQGLEILCDRKREPCGEKVKDVFNGYGCNMAVRLDYVKRYGLRFDENLPLYGWLEDVDFSARLSEYGRVVRCDCLKGVHLGTKRSGRSPGRQLGYSQISNPVYLMSKGTIRVSHAFTLMARNILANLLRSPVPEKWIDRRGRLVGNCIALFDFVRGRLHPNNILSLYK